MTITTPTFGSIPQSAALAEASPDSLTELFSRDPLGFGEQDLARLVTELRKQRERWASAEAGGTSTRPTRAKPVPASREIVSVQSAAELGLD